MELYSIYWKCPNCQFVNSDSWPKGQTEQTMTQPIICEHCGVQLNTPNLDGTRSYVYVSTSYRKKDLVPDD